MIAIMLLAAIAVCTIVYIETVNAEEEEFQAMYEGAAEKLLGTLSVSSQSVNVVVVSNQLRAGQLLRSAWVPSALSRLRRLFTVSIITATGHS